MNVSYEKGLVSNESLLQAFHIIISVQSLRVLALKVNLIRKLYVSKNYLKHMKVFSMRSKKISFFRLCLMVDTCNLNVGFAVSMVLTVSVVCEITL